MTNQENSMKELKKNIADEKKIAAELSAIYNSSASARSDSEKKMFQNQINSLKKSLTEKNNQALQNLKELFLTKVLPQTELQPPVSVKEQKSATQKIKMLSPSEAETVYDVAMSSAPQQAPPVQLESPRKRGIKAKKTIAFGEVFLLIDLLMEDYKGITLVIFLLAL